MICMSPVAFPTAKLLDCVLGAELSQVFNAFQLRHLVQLNSESGGHGGTLSNFEAKLLMGALKLEERPVREVFHSFDDVPCVTMQTPVDMRLLHRVFHCQHTCIPVRADDPKNPQNRKVLDFLNTRDVTFSACTSAAAHLTVGDIVSWYDRSRVLYIGIDDPINKAYQKFTPEHRRAAVIMSGSRAVGFVSKIDLMRGWAIQNQLRDEDAARFGLRTQRVNNTVRSIALTWRQKTLERKGIAAKLASTATFSVDRSIRSSRSDRITITRISPECRAHLNSLLPFSTLSDALVQKKVLFSTYMLLAGRVEAFRPARISAERAAKLLALPRAFCTEDDGAVIVSQGPVEDCTVVFEGTVSVQGQVTPENDAEEKEPVRIFNAEALLNRDALSCVTVVATSKCSVLRLRRSDYVMCCEGSLDAPELSMERGAEQLGHVALDVQDSYVLPNCVA